MRKAEKKALINATKYLSKTLIRMNDVDEWTDKEIFERCGVPQNRISEIKHFEKYQRPVNEKFLGWFIGGGILKVNELIKELKLNDQERDYLDEIAALHGGPEIFEEIKKGFRHGVSKKEIIAALRELRK